MGTAQCDPPRAVWPETHTGIHLVFDWRARIGERPGEFTKEQKVDLMHIALCAILAPAGYFELDHLDQEGWPHWTPIKELPFIDIFSQEIFLKSHIVDYFADIFNI
jgi:hypothetical protein